MSVCMVVDSAKHHAGSERSVESKVLGGARYRYITNHWCYSEYQLNMMDYRL